jgi:predicted nucleic acid-binding Zn ribbon protein
VRRAAPRPLALAVAALRAELEPATPLAAIQRAWPHAAGQTVAAQAQPVAERAGVVTIACRSAVWAQELDLLAPAVVERLNEALGRPAVHALRCVATGVG